jgi:hypothetical protein
MDVRGKNRRGILKTFRCSILPGLDIMQFFLAPEISATWALPFIRCLSRGGRLAVGFLGLGVEPL